MCKWSEDTDRKGRMLMWYRFPLWSTVWSNGVQSYWRQLDASVDHAELSHLRAKRATVLIYQLMLVIGQDALRYWLHSVLAFPIKKAGHTPTTKENPPVKLGCLQQKALSMHRIVSTEHRVVALKDDPELTESAQYQVCCGAYF